jgi:transcriptional antiterminator RfaH
MSGQAGWYLVYLTAGSEAKARDALRSEGITVFLPEYAAGVVHARKATIVIRPLFPRYMFARLDPQRGGFAAVRKTPDVRLVDCAGTPQVVPEKVIRDVSWACDSGEFDALPNGSRVSGEDFPQGCAVKVVGGPLAEFIGKIKAQPHGKRGLVLVELLGREMQVSVPLDRLLPA